MTLLIVVIRMSEKIEFNEAVLKAMVELEGFTYEEAKLTYKKRQDLPATAFCGPNKTYPAHDPPRIRAAIQRLMQFKPTGWKKILKCVCGRAKRAKITSPICKKHGFATFSEASRTKLIDWLTGQNDEDICATC